jgi:hypothetical protein
VERSDVTFGGVTDLVTATCDESPFQYDPTTKEPPTLGLGTSYLIKET